MQSLTLSWCQNEKKNPLAEVQWTAWCFKDFVLCKEQVQFSFISFKAYDTSTFFCLCLEYPAAAAVDIQDVS